MLGEKFHDSINRELGVARDESVKKRVHLIVTVPSTGSLVNNLCMSKLASILVESEVFIELANSYEFLTD